MTIRKSRGAIALLVVLGLIAGAFAFALPVGAQSAVTTQMVICVDASNSIDATEWALMIGGLAAAVEDPAIVPQNGTVELGINKFGFETTPRAEVVVPMTLVDSQATASDIADDIRAMTRTFGWTPTGQAIDLAVEMMTGSENWEVAERHIINITTDGVPAGDPDQSPPYPESRANAENARDQAVAAGITGIHAEMIGVTNQDDIEWMRDEIVFPQPGVIVDTEFPDPNVNGFVILVEDFEDYANAIQAKLLVPAPPELTLAPPTDRNPVGTHHDVVATLLDGEGNPIEGETIKFEIVSGPNAGLSGSDVTDAQGKAYWGYDDAAGVVGMDTIVATCEELQLTSNDVTKTWFEEPPPVPGMGLWGIIATIGALGILGVFMLHRRRAYLNN